MVFMCVCVCVCLCVCVCARASMSGMKRATCVRRMSCVNVGTACVLCVYVRGLARACVVWCCVVFRVCCVW